MTYDNRNPQPQLPPRVPNLVGKTFNLLTVQSFYGKDIRNNSMWNCVCQCGVYKEAIRGFDLKNGQVKSCGCLVIKQIKELSTTHGLSKHPLHKVWEGIKSRTCNPNSHSAKYYHDLGVTMCEEWKNDFVAFYNWALDNGWNKTLQVDKDIIPKKLGLPANIYSPQMCCLVTRSENQNNRTCSIKIECNGVKGTYSEWSKISGIPAKQIKRNLDKGWTIEEAIYNKKKIETYN